MKKFKKFFSKLRKKKRKLATAALLASRLVFGELQGVSSNSNTFESGGKSETAISRVLEQNSPSMKDFNQDAQPEQVLKGTQGAQTALKIRSGGSSSQLSKAGPGARAKNAAKTDFARRQTGKKPTSGKSSESIFV